MTSPISPTTGQPVNFHTNVNRAKTKRWVEAKSYAYDGDEWGDADEYDDEDEEPAPPPASGQSQHAQSPLHLQNPNGRPDQTHPGQQYGDLHQRDLAQSAHRSATNPAPTHSKGPPSFDLGDERRAFSTNTGGWERPYAAAPRGPISPLDQFPQGQTHDPRMGPEQGSPYMTGLQQGQRPSIDQEQFQRAPDVSDERAAPYSDPRTRSYSGPIPPQGRQSQSGGRPSHADIYGGRDSPSRAIPSPLSAVSQSSRDGSPGKSFPPRKSSLGQHARPADFSQPPPIFPKQHSESEPEQPLESPAEAKPLPFIRPADIYRRVAEEKEKERRASEESSRSSVDDREPQKRMKPALDPVAERRSQYGVENPTPDAESAKGSMSAGDLAATTNDDATREPVEVARVSTHNPPQHVDPSSHNPEIGGFHHYTTTPTRSGPTADTDRPTEGTGPQSQDASALRHNPSAGFTSIVHQAFDDSQSKVPPTPSSTSGNSVVRSNSASASDISPIIERASSDSRERPMSSSTITPTTSQKSAPQESDPLPPPIRPGFRRESRTPSSGNSPARRPVSIATSEAPREELGVISATTPTQSNLKSNARSPIPRAESPTKGTVRDLAGKLENRSPSSSPVRGSASVAEALRPSNPRLESFRPSLPGGWNSYTTSTDTASPVRGQTPSESTDNLPRDPAATMDPQKEDMPMAGPPRPREEGYDASGKAFEALAAAGSALSGAFGAATGMHRDDSSENETSPEASTRGGTPVRERPGGLSPVQEALSVASSAPPTPPAKDGPHERRDVQLGYFPSPLRTSKSSEVPTPTRPPMLPALSTDNSPQDTENDRLRKEIVRSLTPKSANADPQPQADAVSGPLPKQTLPSSSTPPEIVPSTTNTLHSEDDSYRDEAAGKEAADDVAKLAPNTDELFTSDQAKQDEGQSVRDVASPGTRPLLQKRFSWETSTENEGTFVNPSETTTTTISHSQISDVAESPQTIRAPTESFATEGPLPQHSENSIDQGPQDKPTIIPVAESNEHLQWDLSPVAQSVDKPRISTDAMSEHDPVTPQHPLPDYGAQSPASIFPPERSQGSPVQPSLPATVGGDISFREILGMNTVQERIRAYDRASQLLAKQSSGLAGWVEVTGWQYPEHHDLLKRNGRLLSHPAHNATHSHKQSASRSKLPRIGASFGGGGGGQQAPADSNHASRTSFGSPSSGKMTSQQVQEEGKKLLQSAGKFGGKAGDAAKGLFAKGKNKFRASSGGDKALPSSRRASQPMVDVENIQHSSGTATTAPQISPILSRANSPDTWSLSYAPSDHVSRTTTVDKPPAAGKLDPEKRQYANLGPPGYSENATDAKSLLRGAPAPSPQVSAVGSTNQDDIPSRSVSEVTQPDEQAQHPSPAASDPHRRAPSRAEPGAVASRRSSPASKSPRRYQLSSPHVADGTVPLADERKPVEGSGDEAHDRPDTASSGSSYSGPAADAPLARTLSDSQSPTGGTEFCNKAPGHDLRSQQPVVAVASSPPPEQPMSDRHGSSPTIPQQSVSLAQENVEGERPKPLESAPAVSPPYEDLTPPYSAAVDSKDVEAAADTLLEKSRDRPQSPPAYQSPIQENAPRLPLQPSAIVPVADLTARKREEGGRPPSRPFSFMHTNQEDVLHRYTPSKESQHSSGGDASLSKDLGLGAVGNEERPDSRSFSRPCNDADLGLHPALRGVADRPLPSQNRDYAPSPRVADHRSPADTPTRPEQQYRIPGPYGQKFKFPNSTSSPQNVGQPSAPPQALPASLAKPEQAPDHAAVSSRRHRSSDLAVLPRLSTTEYSLPGIGPPPPPPSEPSTSTSKVRGPAAKLFRPRSKSRRRATNDDDSDGQERHHKEARKKGRRGGMFRPRSRQEAESRSDHYGSTTAEAGGSQNGFRARQSSPNVKNEGRAKDQDHRSSPRLQRASTSSSTSRTQGKKRGGFLSRLMGKSGKESPPPTKQEPVQRTVSLQPMSSPPLPRPSGPASSVPHEKQQAQWRDQDPVPRYDDPRANSFRGRVPPVGGYFAPASQPSEPTEHPPQPMPRDPDAFIGGHRLSGQRAAQQARQLENLAASRNQPQAEKPYAFPPPPRLSPQFPPPSSPPSTQHFDRGETPQPRAASQRFPPDLRIDTSGRVNANRRSQPLPLAAASSNQDANFHQGDRNTVQPDTAATTNHIPTHSNSNPQRHSPYTDRTSQHSPYGYGSARGLRKDHLSHAIDLHKRSRSPRNGRRDSYDSEEKGIINEQDPANKLGTFSNTTRSRSHRGGAESADHDGQETPWKIGLPASGDRLAGTGAGPGQRIPPGSAPGKAYHAGAAPLPPVELPGSKGPAARGGGGGTDSDEEIVMSSTALPGQQWEPQDMHGYGRWDD